MLFVMLFFFAAMCTVIITAVCRSVIGAVSRLRTVTTLHTQK